MTKQKYQVHRLVFGEPSVRAKNHNVGTIAVVLLGACLSALFLPACSDDDDSDDSDEVTDAGKTKADAGGDCVKSPKTSTDLLNACTDAEHVDKHPDLPLLLPDGGLPPLP